MNILRNTGRFIILDIQLRIKIRDIIRVGNMIKVRFRIKFGLGLM